MTPGDREREREEDLEQLDESELDLLAYLDGELEGDRAVAVEARLRTDRAYAARLKAMQAIGDFLRNDAQRLYANARVDAIVDDVLLKVRQESKPVAEVAPFERPSQIAPPTSRLTRKKKNTVIWVAFGGVMAAAAAMILWVNAHEAGRGPGATASTTASVTEEKVAVVNTATPPPSNPAVPVVPVSDEVEVEGLEVGSEATVIYTRGEEGSSPVVWITGRGEAK